MQLKLLNILRCPGCGQKLSCESTETNEKGAVLEGKLICDRCVKSYPIVRGVPRFVPVENYAASFGYQWNLYKYTQVDRFSKINHSEERFFSETRWKKSSMQQNWILDAGCGNGRFLDVCSEIDCDVVGIDMSSAVDAAAEIFADRENVHIVQASIYELPFADKSFDKIYSIGVIQHTPDPERSIECLTTLVKPEGQLALTIYERKPWTKLYAKYWLRPLTQSIDKKKLLSAIKFLSPVLFPLTEVLFRIPIVNKFFKFIIPYANYVHMHELTLKQRYEWAILDTFDMLSPTYDQPMTAAEVKACLQRMAMKNIERLPNGGVNMIAVR